MNLGDWVNSMVDEMAAAQEVDQEAVDRKCSGPHFLDTFHGSLRGAWTW